jgi:hypothetical protein
LVSGLPSVLVVGGCHDSVALPLTLCVTVIEKGVSEALAEPSDTEIVMPPKVMPATLLPGVPVRRPVELLNVAQLGRLTME